MTRPTPTRVVRSPILQRLAALRWPAPASRHGGRIYLEWSPEVFAAIAPTSTTKRKDIDSIQLEVVSRRAGVLAREEFQIDAGDLVFQVTGLLRLVSGQAGDNQADRPEQLPTDLQPVVIEDDGGDASIDLNAFTARESA